MKLLSEQIDDLGLKLHGQKLLSARARSAERSAERAIVHNPLLVISAIAALVTMVLVPPSTAYLDYFNWHTLSCLLCILMVISAIDSSGFLEFIAHSIVERVCSLRTLVFALVVVTLGCSMVLSNDMTLVTILPLTVMLLRSINREADIPLVFILVTLTANLGGMLLPFGNPHNLFLYTTFGVDFGDFVLTMAPPLVFSMVLIFARSFFVGKADFRYQKPNDVILSKPHVAIYTLLFALCIAMTVQAVPYLIGLIVVVVVLALVDRSAFAKTDYALVMTFVCFFIFSGNIAQIPQISEFIGGLLSQCGAFVTSLVSSQVISNVPTAILLSHFSDDWAGIALGTNIGAVGTPISSLATLITLRQYQNLKTGDNAKFILRFEGYNFAFLIVVFLFEFFVMGVR